jgi:transmembrane 9 superfamily member 2/4
LATAGFLSPASRGALLTALLVMYLLLAVAAGYAAVFVWGMINRSYEGWYNVCWRVSCYFPGITLGEGMPLCHNMYRHVTACRPVTSNTTFCHPLRICMRQPTCVCALQNAASPCAGVLSVLNLLIWHTGSSGAIPLGAFFSLVSLWFIISIPLCYSGAALRILTDHRHYYWSCREHMQEGQHCPPRCHCL